MRKFKIREIQPSIIPLAPPQLLPIVRYLVEHPVSACILMGKSLLVSKFQFDSDHVFIRIPRFSTFPKANSCFSTISGDRYITSPVLVLKGTVPVTVWSFLSVSADSVHTIPLNSVPSKNWSMRQFCCPDFIVIYPLLLQAIDGVLKHFHLSSPY